VLLAITPPSILLGSKECAVAKSLAICKVIEAEFAIASFKVVPVPVNPLSWFNKEALTLNPANRLI
jgi:hypothetical protein